MSSPRKSRRRLLCPGCGRVLRRGQLVQWFRWSDGELQGPACLRCEKFVGPALYDEDGELVAYRIVVPLDWESPELLPIGADPLQW